jgi:hypothetical protein
MEPFSSRAGTLSMKRRNFAFISGPGNRPGASSIFHFISGRTDFLKKVEMKLDLARIYRVEHLRYANPGPMECDRKGLLPARLSIALHKRPPYLLNGGLRLPPFLSPIFRFFPRSKYGVFKTRKN